MSRKYQLTWNSKQARWFKRLDGKQYAVSCKALQADYPHLYQSATKEGSYKAANQWWLDRLADLTTHPQHAIYQEAIELRRYMALWCELEGDEDSYE